MRGKKAKRLRKEVWGSGSQRDRRYSRDENGTVRCIGRRAIYLRKKAGV